MTQPESEKSAKQEASKEESFEKRSLPTSYETEGLEYYELDGFRTADLHVNVNDHVPTDPRGAGAAHEPYGTHITRVAANKMVEKYWEEVTGSIPLPECSPEISKETTANNVNVAPANMSPEWESILKPTLMAAKGYVIFSREVITWLLAQRHCEGIKFYHCINHDKEHSLVLVGVDKNDRDLGEKSSRGSVIDMKFDDLRPKDTGELIAPQNSAIIEVGGPNKSLTGNKTVSMWDALKDKDDAYGQALHEYICRLSRERSNKQVHNDNEEKK